MFVSRCGIDFLFGKAYEEALRDAEGKQHKDAGQFEKELAQRQAIEEKLRKVQWYLLNLALFTHTVSGSQ